MYNDVCTNSTLSIYYIIYCEILNSHRVCIVLKTTYTLVKLAIIIGIDGSVYFQLSYNKIYIYRAILFTINLLIAITFLFSSIQSIKLSKGFFFQNIKLQIIVWTKSIK